MTPQSQANDIAFNDRFRQLFAPLFAERQGRQGLQAEELTGAPRQAGELTGAPRSQGPDWPNPGWLETAPRQPGTLRASSLPASQPASQPRTLRALQQEIQRQEYHNMQTRTAYINGNFHSYRQQQQLDRQRWAETD